MLIFLPENLENSWGGVNLQRTKFVEIVTKKQKIKTN